MCQFDRKVQYFVNWTPYFSEKNPDLKNKYRRASAMSYKIHGAARAVTRTVRSHHSLPLRITVYESNISKSLQDTLLYFYFIFFFI